MYLLQGYTRTGALREAETQKDIEALPPKKKAFAEKYLENGYSPTEAFYEVQVRENIEALPADLKAFVKKYLENGISPSKAMEEGQRESERYAQENAQKIISSIKERK